MSCALNLLLMVEDAKYKDFADRLNKSLQEKSIGVKELSEFSGVSYEMARRYTLGTAKPRDEKMIRIAERLAVSPAYLDYGVPVNGGDMPTLCPKDLLFIDSRIERFSGDGVYVFNFEDSTFVKRLQKVKGRRLAVLSDNEHYPPFFIEEHEMNEVYIFGKLIRCLPLKMVEFG